MGYGFDVKVELLSAPGTLPMRVRVSGGRRARFFGVVWGALVIVFALFIWSGEVPIGSLVDPQMTQIVALAVGAVGLFQALRGLVSSGGTKEYLLTRDTVEKTAGTGGTWTEPLSRYRGVRWRRRYTQERKSLHVVELVHSDAKRTVPLFARADGLDHTLTQTRDTFALVQAAFEASNSGKGEAEIHKEAEGLARRNRGEDVRDYWEGYAALLGVPAIDARGDVEEVREVEDLDKSVADLAQEGKISREWDDRPPPEGLDVQRIDGDDGTAALKVRISASTLPRMLVGLFYAIGAAAVLIGIFTLNLGALVAGALFIALPFGVRRFEKGNNRVLTITRKDVHYENPLRRKQEGFTAALSEIERVHLDRQRGARVEGRLVKKTLADKLTGLELVISTDKWERRIGQGLDEEALKWLRDYLESAIANA